MTTKRIAPISEFSAFGFILCCVGVVWTIISWFQLAKNLQTILQTNKVTGPSVVGISFFIPIWAQINIMNAADALNKVSKAKQLKGEDLNPMLTLILSFIIAPVALFLLFKKHNEVVAQLD